LNTDQHGTFTEDWSGEILPGQQKIYEFSAKLATDLSQPLYLCVDARLEDAGKVFAQDDSCMSLSPNFKAFELWPNPASESVYTRFLLPKPGRVSIEITMLDGRRVSMQDIKMEKGLHDWSYSVLGLSDGMYLMKISYEKETAVKPFNVLKSKK
jgi:hypothetical protein